MEKSDKFDEWMLNHQNMSYQNFALKNFSVAIAMFTNLTWFVMLCRNMKFWSTFILFWIRRIHLKARSYLINPGHYQRLYHHYRLLNLIIYQWSRESEYTKIIDSRGHAASSSWEKVNRAGIWRNFIIIMKQVIIIMKQVVSIKSPSITPGIIKVISIHCCSLRSSSGWARFSGLIHEHEPDIIVGC